MLNDIKAALRIGTAVTAFDTEITDLINAALADLGLSGAVDEAIITTDPLIRRAVTTYVKANFGWDNPDAERLAKAYDLLKGHITLSTDYAYCAVTFEVTDDVTLAAIRMAEVTFDGETKTTDATGLAMFRRRTASNLKYKVTADDYEPDDDEDNLLDVAASVAVPIALTAR